MFTVKQVTLSGIELIWEAVNVVYTPSGHAVGEGPEIPARQKHLTLTLPEHGPVEVYGGTVFVMNRFGKTVSRYDLGASRVPYEADAPTTARFVEDVEARDPTPQATKAAA